MVLVAVANICRAQMWTRVSELPSTSISSLFAQGDTLIAGTDSTMIFISTDHGMTWTRSARITDDSVYIDAVTIFQGKIIAGTGNAGIFTSSDQGANWEPLNDGLSGLGSKTIKSFVERNDTLYAATIGGGVFQLQDSVWQPFGDLSGSLAGNVEFLGLKGDSLVAGAGGNGYIWFAPDGATDWTEVLIAPLQTEAFIVSSVVSFDGVLLAGSTYGVHRSFDGGAKWEYSGSGMPMNRYVTIIRVGDTLYAAASSAGTSWYTSTTGDAWTFAGTTPFTYATVYAGGTLFAARVDGLWKHGVVTDVAPGHTVPHRFTLHQNYPNPFNSTTVIPFEMSDAGLAHLSVYNALGQEVAQLVNEPRSVGRHSVTWNATGQPSGMYFYRLRSGPFSTTKKLVLLQ